MSRVWVTGAGGFIGHRLCAMLHADGHQVTALVRRPPDRPLPESARRELDIVDGASIRQAALEDRPDLIVHGAAIADPVTAENAPAQAQAVNADATGVLCELARELDCRLWLLSTDQVFDGRNAPYAEEARTCPVHAYGRTKVAAEQHVAGLGEAGCVLRVGLVFGRDPARRRGNLSGWQDAAQDGRTLRLFRDEVRTPVWLEDVVTALTGWVDRALPACVNIAGSERMDRHSMVARVARRVGLKPDQVQATLSSEANLPIARPPDLSLDNRRLRELWPKGPTPYEQAIDHCLA